MSDTFTQYEKGLTRLLEQLGKGHPRYTEALTLQARLLENITQCRKYGDTETTRAERAQIVDRLNHLALETLGEDFNRISKASRDGVLSPQPFEHARQVDKRSGGVYFQGEGHVQIQGDVVGGDQVKSTHETSFHSSVTGPVHTGSGDIRVGSMRVDADASLESLMASLRQAIAEGVPRAERPRARQRLTDLFDSILKDELDLDLIEAALDWFRKHRPSLAQAIEAALLHPAVIRTVESAHNLTAIEFRRQLGLISDEE